MGLELVLSRVKITALICLSGMCERYFSNNRLYCCVAFYFARFLHSGFEEKHSVIFFFFFFFFSFSVWSAITSKKVNLLVISIEPIWDDLSRPFRWTYPKNLGYLYHAVRQYSSLQTNAVFRFFGNVFVSLLRFFFFLDGKLRSKSSDLCSRLPKTG